MEKLEKAIKKTLTETGIEKYIEKGNAMLLWSSIVGKKIDKETETKNIKNGVLTVKASTPAWRNELMFQKKDIIQKINKNLKKTIIRDIRFI